MHKMYILPLKEKTCRVSTMGLPPALSRVVANVQKQMTPTEAPLSARPHSPPVSAQRGGASAAPARSRRVAGGGGTQRWPRRFAWSGHLTGDVTSQRSSTLGRGKVWMQSACLGHVVAQGAGRGHLRPSASLLSLPSATDFAVNLWLFLDTTTASYSVGACSPRARLQPAPAPRGRGSQPGTGTCPHLPCSSQGVCTGEGNTSKSSSGSSAYQLLY